jgi:hypothetical protein
MDIEQKLSAVVGIYFQLVEKCEGDISNLEVTLKQDESAVKVFENLLIIADEIDNDTSGKFVSKDLRFILDWVRTISKLRYGSGRRIGDILHEVMERYVSDEDEEAVSILDKLASLPSYEPNEWMRRSFLIESIFIRPLSTVPPDLISRLEETMSCFIYGNILAGVTLCRATLKTCLHYKYPNLGWEDSGDKKMSLGMFINDW